MDSPRCLLTAATSVDVGDSVSLPPPSAVSAGPAAETAHSTPHKTGPSAAASTSSPATATAATTRKKRSTEDKQRVVNANHLLNFSLPPRQHPPSFHSPARRGRPTNYQPYNKERFVNSNFRFVMSSLGTYDAHLMDPDAMVPWADVEQVIIPCTAAHSCPICLTEHPVVPKVSRCGHVFCYGCILHFLAMGEKNRQKCPLCHHNDAISARDLKSVLFMVVRDFGKLSLNNSAESINNSNNTNIDADSTVDEVSKDDGTVVTLKAFKRSTGSMNALPVTNWGNWAMMAWPVCETEACIHLSYAKILIASTGYLHDAVLERERHQLTEALVEARSAKEVEEAMFLESALQLVEQRFADLASTTADRDARFRQVRHARSHAQAQQLTTATAAEDFYYFYQAADGQLLFLHPLDVKILKDAYTAYEKFPAEIRVRISAIEESTLDEELRKRYRYLGHLPLACDVSFCEVDWLANGNTCGPADQPVPLVVPDVLRRWKADIKARTRRRQDKLRKEEKEHQAARRRHNSSSFPAGSADGQPLSGSSSLSVDSVYNTLPALSAPINGHSQPDSRWGPPRAIFDFDDETNWTPLAATIPRSPVSRPLRRDQSDDIPAVSLTSTNGGTPASPNPFTSRTTPPPSSSTQSLSSSAPERGTYLRMSPTVSFADILASGGGGAVTLPPAQLAAEDETPPPSVRKVGKGKKKSVVVLMSTAGTARTHKHD